MSPEPREYPQSTVSAAPTPRRVAVVDPYSTGAQLAQVLAEHGVETVAVLATQPPAGSDPGAFAWSEYAHVHTYRNSPQATVQTLAALGVSAVMAGCESGVHLADHLARRMGLPGNDPATSALRRQKYAMAQMLSAVGIAHPRTFAACSVRDARRAAHLIGAWPVVVKPVASAGGDHVVFARSMAELDRAVSAIFDTRDVFHQVNQAVICQQYVAGPQFAINTVSRSGRHRPVEVWLDTRTSLTGHRLIYDQMDLLAPADPRIPGLLAYVGRCLEALGFDHGPAHSDVILTDSGPVLIEAGARLQPEDSVPLMRAATGSSHTDAAVETLLDEQGQPDTRQSPLYPYGKPVSRLFLQSPPEAVVGPAAVLDALLEIPAVAGLVRPLHPGGPLAPTVDLATSPGTVYVIGRERKSVQAACDQVRALESNGLYAPLAAAPDRPATVPMAFMEAA